MGYADIWIALFTGYLNHYPYLTKTRIPYLYSYSGENIRIRIRIRTSRELSDPKGIRIRFSSERMETIRSVFVPTATGCWRMASTRVSVHTPPMHGCHPLQVKDSKDLEWFPCIEVTVWHWWNLWKLEPVVDSPGRQSYLSIRDAMLRARI